MPQYGKLLSSKKFRLKKDAEAWANKEKEKYKKQGQGIRKVIDFTQSSQQWTAKIYINVTKLNKS